MMTINVYETDDADRMPYGCEQFGPGDDFDSIDDFDYSPSWDDISGELFVYRGKLAVAMKRKAMALCERSKNHGEYCAEYARWYLKIAPRFGLTNGLETARYYIEKYGQ